MKRRRLCMMIRGAVIAAVMLCTTWVCTAQTGTGGAGADGESENTRRITGIEIHGLKRTKESYLMQSLAQFNGMAATDAAARGVEAVLNAQGLFTDVSAEVVPDGDGAKIVASVNEKVSLLPIPVAGGAAGNWMVGLMLMDMNAFGIHNIFTGGFIYGNAMQVGMISYTKLPKGILWPGFSAAGGFTNSDDKEFTDFNDNTFAEDDMITAFASLSLIMPLSRHFSVSLGGDYTFRHFDDGAWDPAHLLMGTGAVTWRAGGRGDWLPIESTVTLKGKAGGDLGNGAQAAQEASLKGHFQCPFTKRARLDFGFNGILQHDMPYPFQTGKRDIGSSIAMPDFHSNKYGMLRGLCEVGLVRGRYAMLSLYGQFEAVAARDIDDTFVWCTGPGAGLLVYLNRIIFPSIMGGASYNINQNKWQASFSVGMSF